MTNNYINKQDIIKDVINKYSQNFWIPKNITTLKNNQSFGIADYYSYVENIDDHFIKQLKIPLISKDKETKLMQTQKIFLSFSKKQSKIMRMWLQDASTMYNITILHLKEIYFKEFQIINMLKILWINNSHLYNDIQSYRNKLKDINKYIKITKHIPKCIQSLMDIYNEQIKNCQNMINDNYKQINQFIEKLKKSQISKKIKFKFAKIKRNPF